MNYLLEKFKRFFAFVSISCIFIYAHAQDVIVKTNGNTILAKVIEVGTEEVSYKKWSNPKGPTYKVRISDLMAINYANGEKDDFSNQQSSSSTNSKNSQLVEKKADVRNNEIINLINSKGEIHNKVTESFKEKKKMKLADVGAAIMKVTDNSIMSNEDIEVNFEPYYFEDANQHFYHLYIINKTNELIYIDKAACFQIYKDGSSFCYYNGDKQSVSNGSQNGVGISAGVVADVLGIGGLAGQIASGINLSGGNSNVVTNTAEQQRIIIIPPKSRRSLSVAKYVKVSSATLFDYAQYAIIEPDESFDGGDFWHYKGIGNGGIKLNEREIAVNNGSTKSYTEGNSPYTREYVISYSKDQNFSKYSMLKFKFFIRHILGGQWLREWEYGDVIHGRLRFE